MVIAAVKTQDDFEKALKSNVKIIFDLSPDIVCMAERIKKARCFDKMLFVHIDLAAGIGKDKSGIAFLKHLGVDGILSTKASLIKIAKEAGLKAVQRFFIIDSKSVDATVEGMKITKADMIEIMPGIVVRVIRRLKAETSVPIIAGGLIETEADRTNAEKNGAFAVSTGNCNLWK